MPPFTYRLRFLISRNRLPHTAEDEPHLIDIDAPSGDPVERHLRPGTGSRPDNLVLARRGIPTEDEALEQALAAKRALMRAGLISNVPMLFGNNTSSTRLAPALIDRVREATGLTPRPDVHGIDIIDEAHGPTFPFRLQAEGHVQEPIGRFLDHLAESFSVSPPGLASDDRLGLAIEVFMAASTERTPRARFLDFVTVLEILAEERPSSPETVAVVEAALTQLKKRRGDMEEAEARSLEASLVRLRYRSIGRSVRDLAVGLDPNGIDGYRDGDVRAFLGRCYQVRSTLVHDGVAPNGAEVAQLAGSLSFLLRHILISRIDGAIGG
jgi:hypothetical protein